MVCSLGIHLQVKNLTFFWKGLREIFSGIQSLQKLSQTSGGPGWSGQKSHLVQHYEHETKRISDSIIQQHDKGLLAGRCVHFSPCWEEHT